jgi:hypothetical protein
MHERREFAQVIVRSKHNLLTHSKFIVVSDTADINPLNAELNPICHLLALLEGATIVVVSRLRVNAGVY